MPAPLHTIGYEGRTPGGFLDALVAAGVERVVDVRELPLSRRQGFSKRALIQALAEHGIRYDHVRLLGNPKENRERYWSGDVEAGAEVFRDRLHNGAYSALVELAMSLDGEPTCLLCVERDHAVCHRNVIVDSVRELRPDVAVRHL